jgi:hypothetical protein
MKNIPAAGHKHCTACQCAMICHLNVSRCYGRQLTSSTSEAFLRIRSPRNGTCRTAAVRRAPPAPTPVIPGPDQQPAPPCSDHSRGVVKSPAARRPESHEPLWRLPCFRPLDPKDRQDEAPHLAPSPQTPASAQTPSVPGCPSTKSLSPRSLVGLLRETYLAQGATRREATRTAATLIGLWSPPTKSSQVKAYRTPGILGALDLDSHANPLTNSLNSLCGLLMTLQCSERPR